MMAIFWNNIPCIILTAAFIFTPVAVRTAGVFGSILTYVSKDSQLGVGPCSIAPETVAQYTLPKAPSPIASPKTMLSSSNSQ